MDSFNDSDALVEANRAIGVESEYTQVKPGKFRSSFATSVRDDIVIANESHDTAVHIRAASSGSDFLLFTNATQASVLLYNGREVTNTRLNIAPPDTDLNFTTSGAIRCPQLSIPADRLLQSLSVRMQRNIDHIDDVLGDIRIEPEKSQLLAVAIGTGGDAAEIFDCVVEKIYEAMERQSGKSLSPCRGRPLSNNLDVLNKAIDFIHANVSNAITIESVCKACQCSQSKLERIFVRYLSITPKRYVLCHKLNAAKKELSLIEPSHAQVIDVAHRFGFNHSGRFSSYYHEFCGEYPHETLKRSAAS